MRIVFLGGPLSGSVPVDFPIDRTFADIIAAVEAKGTSLAGFRLHVAELDGKRVRATARVIGPTETPASVGLPAGGAIVLLRPSTAATGEGENDSLQGKWGEGEKREPQASAGSTPAFTPTTTTMKDYRSRLMAIYEKYEPSKVGTVDAILRKFQGKEEAVIRQLVKKFGPEPVTTVQGHVQSFNCEGEKSSSLPVVPELPTKAESVETVEPLGVEKNVSVFKKLSHEELKVTSETQNRFDSNDDSSVTHANASSSSSAAHCKKSLAFTMPSDEPAFPVFQTGDKPQMESYGVQHVVSPFAHEHPVEPFSETDEPPLSQAHVETPSTKAKTGGVRTHFSLETANEFLKQDAFDPEKRLLRDLSDVLPEWQHLGLPLSNNRRGKWTNSYLQNVINQAVGSLRGAAENQVRRSYWAMWELKLAQHVAKDLIEGNTWAKTCDGVSLVDNVPHSLVVQDFDGYILKNRIRARNKPADFSDDLQKALRLLLYTAKQQVSYSPTVSEDDAIAYAELSPVCDSRNLTKSLFAVTLMLNDITTLSEQCQSQDEEYTKLKEENETLRVRLHESEASVSCFSLLEANFEGSYQRQMELEGQLAASQKELLHAKHQIQYLQRELKNERGKSVITTDHITQQKDQAMASLQQELSKVRLKLNVEKKEKESLELQLKEAKMETTRNTRVVRRSGTPCFSSSTTAAAAATSFRRERSKQPSLLCYRLPKGYFSPPVQQRPLAAGKVSDNEFYPDMNRDEYCANYFGKERDMSLMRGNL